MNRRLEVCLAICDLKPATATGVKASWKADDLSRKEQILHVP